ncbi:MAG: hypothetical protein M1609_00075, partial [Firmicutes bacterium]|nr:hypothetical protein [Bacillota bacterium]
MAAILKNMPGRSEELPQFFEASDILTTINEAKTNKPTIHKAAEEGWRANRTKKVMPETAKAV